MKRIFILVLVLALGITVTYWLIPAAAPEESNGGYIDMHVHVGCIGAGDSGCHLSRLLSEGYKYPFYLRAIDTNAGELDEKGDSIVLEKLCQKFASSRQVGKAGVLASDGVIGADGKFDYEQT